MVNLLRRHCDRLVALVPLQATSAATMLALGVDRILMGPPAYLSAVDTSPHHAPSRVDRNNNGVPVSLDVVKRATRLRHAEQGQRQAVPENASVGATAYLRGGGSMVAVPLMNEADCLAHQLRANQPRREPLQTHL